jgi:hypothetical protein
MSIAIKMFGNGMTYSNDEYYFDGIYEYCSGMINDLVYMFSWWLLLW